VPCLNVTLLSIRAAWLAHIPLGLYKTGIDVLVVREPQHIVFAGRWPFTAANSPPDEKQQRQWETLLAAPPGHCRPGWFAFWCILNWCGSLATGSPRVRWWQPEPRAWVWKGTGGSGKRSHYGSRIMIKPLPFPSLLLFQGTLSLKSIYFFI
jgi:hypothetical protein